MASPTPPASERSDRAEWLQSPTRILVRRRSRLGRWYYVLRPLAIAYSILFRALREVLALLVWIALWVYWIGWRVLAGLLWLPLWLLKAYVRLRYGKQAADELRQVEVQAAADGIAWRQRYEARLARKVGWPTDSDTSADE
jgi:hypothetical protein